MPVNMPLKNARLLEIIIFHIIIYFLLSIYITFYNSGVRSPPVPEHKHSPFREHGAPAFHIEEAFEVVTEVTEG